MARGLARAGRPGDAGQALSLARAERERASDEDEIGGAFGLTDAQYHYLTGTTQLWRYDPGQAISESTQAIELFQARRPGGPHYGPEALTRIDQASAYLQQDDLDGAHAALRPVLNLPPDLRLDLLTQNLGLARQALAQPAFRDATLARQLQEEIEAYCRESIVNDLRD
jgi:predicted negative regulator of RcsB-dependent stress response